MAITGITIGGGAGGAVQTVVPDVVGKTEADAQQALKDADLRVGRRVEVRSPGTVGTVLRQNPTAGEPVALNSAVTLFVIVAPPTPPADVGKQLDEIKKAISDVADAVGALETDEEAEKRTERILDKLDEMAGTGKYGETS